MSNIHYTPEAENDLAVIKEYFTVELNSPAAAINIVMKIAKRIRNMERFPESGAQLSSVIDIVTDYRFLVCENYMAFYRVDEKNVYTIRVLYGRRDYVKILFGELPTEEIE